MSSLNAPTSGATCSAHRSGAQLPCRRARVHILVLCRLRPRSGDAIQSRCGGSLPTTSQIER
eukprot:5420040-Pyramimonas_sp.AAC.1